MYRYIVLAGLLAAVWMFNIRWISHALREGMRSELFMHLGLGFFFSLAAVELTLSSTAPWGRLDIRAVRIVGFVFFLPAIALVIAAILSLRNLGQARDLTESEQLVTGGVFRFLRQPMTLGIALWSLALVLVFQSLFSVCMAAASVTLMWLAARSEGEYNRRKFGHPYTEYASTVPMWNIFKSLFGRRGS